MANIKKYGKTTTVAVSYSIPSDIAEKIEEEAKEKGISRSEVVSRLLITHYNINASLIE